MKIIYRTALLLFIIATLSMPSMAAGEDLFDDPYVRDEISLKKRPVYFDNEDRRSLDGIIDDGSYLPKGGYLEYHYLPNRLALTGETCSINKLPNVVSVGAWSSDLDHLLNDDLDDYCEFDKVVGIGLTVNPLFSIRDRSAYYAKGTTAGFCVVAGSGKTVLSLDVVKALSIGFYRDGKLVKAVPVQEGQDGSGVTLSLIQIPGTEDACVSLTAEAPGVFDEITLDYAGGLNVSLGQSIKVKYGFVGKSREFTITKNGQNGAVVADADTQTPFQKYDEKNRNVDLDYVKGWNPFLLGLPFPILDNEMEKFIDADLQNYVTITPILSVGYQGGTKFMMKDTAQPDREVFEAGTEVGFVYDFGAALSLDAGNFMNIVLFDRHGNKVAEETISAGVLNLSVAKGGGGNTSIVSKVPFSGAEIRFLTVISVDLGGIFVKYAYIREKVDIRHHCPINPSMDTPICPKSSEYQLMSNPSVSVTWSVAEQPEGGKATVTPDGHVSGLGWVEVTKTDKNGETFTVLENRYVFRAVAADGCEDYVELIFDGFDEADCEYPLVNTPVEEEIYDSNGNEIEKYSYDCHVEGVDGGLLVIQDLQYKENVLKDDNSYSVYVGGLKLGNNIPIVGIRKNREWIEKEGLIYDAELEPGNEGKRMGFIVESTVEGLNLSLLSFYQIRCYHEGREVFSQVIDESNVVSADVGGANKSQKMRYSVVVPPEEQSGDFRGQPMKVDQIMLWNSGVLEAKLGELHIYNAFWEEPDSGCSDVMGCSTTVLSSTGTHTTIDFERVQTGDAVSVATAVNDLDNIVDDDIESYATIFKTVGISGITVAINMGRTLDYRHQLGILTDNNTYAAGVKVADVIQVQTLYRGEPTGDTFNDWNIIDANVIGYGDKKQILIQPRYVYDEVLIKFIGTVNVLNDIRVYGLFLRGDVDNDGLPDCMDSSPCTDNITSVSVNEICVGEPVIVTVEGIEGTYKVTFTDPSTTEELTTSQADGDKQAEVITKIQKEYEIEIPQGEAGDIHNKVSRELYTSDTAGLYQVVVYDKDGTPALSGQYKVHPGETTWKTDASSSDWSKWDNWSDGSPYCCTNVIIPSDATIYPDLSEELTDSFDENGMPKETNNWDRYCCNFIHFEPGAAVNRVTNLNYVQAWVEMELNPNRYYLLSAPLQSMLTGDMFIPAEMKGIHSGAYFKPLNPDNSPQNRFDPTIYQRMWYQTAYDRIWNTASQEYAPLAPVAEQLTDAAQTCWSKVFNQLNTPYRPGTGFSLWVDNGELPENQKFRFRFPKLHTEYNYYSDYTHDVISDGTGKNQVFLKETDLDRKGAGRFIYEISPEFTTLHFELKEEGSGAIKYEREIYKMNRADGATFQLEAKEGTTEYFLFGNPFMSGIDIAAFLKGNALIKEILFYDGNTTRKIMLDEEGNLAQTTDLSRISPMQSVFVKCNGERSVLDVNILPSMLAGPVIGISDNDTGIEMAGGEPSMRVILSSENKEAAMLLSTGKNLRSEALFDNEVAPIAAIFVSEDGKGYDVISDRRRLPLTLIKQEGESATLDFRSFRGFNLNEYRLLDVVEGVEYFLDRPVEIPAEVGAIAGRYVLAATASGIDSMTEESDIPDIIIEAKRGTLLIRSLDDRLASISLYSLDGSRQSAYNVHGAFEVSIPANPGINIVEVTTVEGYRKKVKILL